HTGRSGTLPGSPPLAPAIAPPPPVVLQFARDDEIKFGGSHSAQVLLARDRRLTGDWQTTQEYQQISPSRYKLQLFL
uniref:Uncharacterized protein n=1 Tax=Oryza meridionalis TaxID=40149 RepID=A0A0E0EAV0_9ORYZ